MQKKYNIILELTSKPLIDSDRYRLLNDFASEFGWRPSDSLDEPSLSDFSNAHLVVEHGLENSAVITFFKNSRRFSDLDRAEKNHLLSISYNNLVEWHIQVEFDKVTYVFNRTDPLKFFVHHISRDDVGKLRGEAFEQVTGKKPNPNLRALDSALISTISDWKRILSAELDSNVSNSAFSALFNAIIFVRAIEDHFRRIQFKLKKPDSFETMLEKWKSNERSGLTLPDFIKNSLDRIIRKNIPSRLIDIEQLRVFDSLGRGTVFALLSDFYINKFAPYKYDFSLMSKHALSRIYEHYVSILRTDESPQLALFPSLPEKEKNKAYGSIYTPQFVARFFARYLQENIPPAVFKRIKVADPACGSGIFLRTILELICDPTKNGVTTELIENSFSNVFGLDVDENACQATRLSLALLHLILIDSLPKELNVISVESIEYFINNPEIKNNYDAVIANPPFVSLATQKEEMRMRVTSFMEGYASGRIDMYLAFLRIGLEILKPGGYGLFVLPHSFLLSNNAEKMRKIISKTCWIRCIADLSAIRVFDDSGSYIILLIFQKIQDSKQIPPPATVIKCQDQVGPALHDALEGKIVETNIYSIYEVGQDTFKGNDWLILPPAESAIKRKFDTLPTLGKFLDIHQGFISGADEIFILSEEHIPAGEEELFVSYLRDREMKPFITPDATDNYFFYPYINNRKLDEKELSEKYPKTWEYLSSKKDILTNRSPVRKGQLPWWQPTRPRVPERMMRPKIVTPHLVLVPRFSLDSTGKYAISHSPLLYPKEKNVEHELLRFFLAVLNSDICYWYISSHSHKYSRGYMLLEVKTLKKTPVPDPSKVSSTLMRRILNTVDNRLFTFGVEAMALEKKLDELIFEAYGLSFQERKALGFIE